MQIYATNQLGAEATADAKRTVAVDMIDRFYNGDVSSVRAGVTGLTDLESAMAKEGMKRFKAAYGDAFKVDFRDVLTGKRFRAVLDWLDEPDNAKVKAKVKLIAGLQVEDDDDFELPDMETNSDES